MKFPLALQMIKKQIGRREGEALCDILENHESRLGAVEKKRVKASNNDELKELVSGLLARIEVLESLYEEAPATNAFVLSDEDPSAPLSLGGVMSESLKE